MEEKFGSNFKKNNWIITQPEVCGPNQIISAQMKFVQDDEVAQGWQIVLCYLFLLFWCSGTYLVHYICVAGVKTLHLKQKHNVTPSPT